MLVVETVARIRREFFVKGKSIKEIVRDVGVSRNTVRKVLRSGETAFAYERPVQPLPSVWCPSLQPAINVALAFPRANRCPGGMGRDTRDQTSAPSLSIAVRTASTATPRWSPGCMMVTTRVSASIGCVSRM